MRAKAHALGGAASFFIFLSLLKFIGITLSHVLLVVCFFSSLLGALIPDIDFRASNVHRGFFYTALFLLLAIFISSKTFFDVAASLSLLVLLLLFRKKVRHRKFFHSMRFGIMSSLLVGTLAHLVFRSFLPAFFFFLGFFSHLILDRKV